MLLAISVCDIVWPEIGRVLCFPSKKPQVPDDSNFFHGSSSRLKSSIAPRPGAFVGAGFHPSTAGATNVGSGTAKIAALTTAPGAKMAQVKAFFHIYVTFHPKA